MKKKGSELIFISQIKRDGSGVFEVDEGYIEVIQDTVFKVHTLSLNKETFIAIGFHSFVVKLKP